MAREIDKKGNRAYPHPSTGTVMKSSIIVSMLVHLCILLGMQKAFPIDWIAKPLQTYHVELLRPPVTSLDDKKEPAMKLENTKPEEKTSPEVSEDTISLDTKDKKYRSYAKIIKSRLMQHWNYPKKAWEDLIEGEVQVIFSLDRQGHLKGVKITRPSNSDILNGETLRTIRAAAPFPPFPGSVSVIKLNINASFAYRLTAKR